MLVAMGKAKWWICDSCSSLNDLPAAKCYKCRAEKPADPKLIDDNYAEVGGGKRVGVSVDRSAIGDLVRRDPVETQDAGGMFGTFGVEGGKGQARPPGSAPAAYDPDGQGTRPVGPAERLAGDRRPLRDPTPRGIEQVGGRHWTEGLEPIAHETAAPTPDEPPPPMGGPASSPPPDAPPPPMGGPALPPPPSGPAPPPGVPPPPPTRSPAEDG
jgi:hypothetical protein